MHTEEQTFFQKLGERIATLRNERGLTQVQLAELLGCSQQQVLSFEKGRRRVPVSALPGLSKALGVPVEDLLVSVITIINIVVITINDVVGRRFRRGRDWLEKKRVKC